MIICQKSLGSDLLADLKLFSGLKEIAFQVLFESRKCNVYERSWYGKIEAGRLGFEHLRMVQTRLPY